MLVGVHRECSPYAGVWGCPPSFLHLLCAIPFNSSSKPRSASQLRVSPVTTTSTSRICAIAAAPLNCIATFSSATVASNNSQTVAELKVAMQLSGAAAIAQMHRHFQFGHRRLQQLADGLVALAGRFQERKAHPDQPELRGRLRVVGGDGGRTE